MARYTEWASEALAHHFAVESDELRLKRNARGGPALGDTFVGAVAGALGPVTALTLGGVLAAVYAGGFIVRPNPVRSYQGVGREEDAAVSP